MNNKERSNKRSWVRHIIFEHVEQGGLAGVVEAQEQDLGLLGPQSKHPEDPIQPVHQEHLLLDEKENKGGGQTRRQGRSYPQ